MLNLKVQEEKQELLALAEWQLKLKKEKDFLNQLKNDCQLQAEKISNKKMFFAFELKNHANYLYALQHKINVQTESCNRLEGEVATVLKKATAIVKERKILEKIKENRYQNALNELKLKEQKQLDETALNKFYLAETRGGN